MLLSTRLASLLKMHLKKNKMLIIYWGFKYWKRIAVQTAGWWVLCFYSVARQPNFLCPAKRPIYWLTPLLMWGCLLSSTANTVDKKPWTLALVLNERYNKKCWKKKVFFLQLQLGCENVQGLFIFKKKLFYLKIKQYADKSFLCIYKML